MSATGDMGCANVMPIDKLKAMLKVEGREAIQKFQPVVGNFIIGTPHPQDLDTLNCMRHLNFVFNCTLSTIQR